MKKTYIYYARKKAKKTQAQVAASLGLKPQTYANKEQRLDFSPEEFSKLSNLLKLLPTHKDDQVFTLNEPVAEYGKPGNEYRRLLKEFSDIKKMLREIHGKDFDL